MFCEGVPVFRSEFVGPDYSAARPPETSGLGRRRNYLVLLVHKWRLRSDPGPHLYPGGGFIPGPSSVRGTALPRASLQGT